MRVKGFSVIVILAGSLIGCATVILDSELAVKEYKNRHNIK